jgi:hypothetical protein
MKPTAQVTSGIRFEVLTEARVTTFRQGFLEDAAKTVELMPGGYILRVSDRENRVLHETPFRVAKEPVTLEVGP